MEVNKEKVIDAIKKSGFPLELEVAKVFKNSGYSIQPSKIVHDKEKDRDYEIDLIASKNEEITWDGKKMLIITQIAVECKDYNLPFVFMGIDNIQSPQKGFFDPDSYYCHLESSRDGNLPNKYALAIFDTEHGGQDLKEKHHHFKNDIYFHSATALDKKGQKKNPYYKLHTPNVITHPVSKLGSFVGDFHGYGKSPDMRYNEMLEEVTKMPVLRVCFLVYIHTSNQFRYNHKNEDLVPSLHTPVRFNRSYCNESINYIVDFIQKDGLKDSIKTIEKTSSLIGSYLPKWIFAN